MNSNIKKEINNLLDNIEKLDQSSQSNQSLQYDKSNLLNNSNKVSTPDIKKSKKNRCYLCNKKLKIHTMYLCKCNHYFCGEHRYYHTHNCKYDNKKENIENLRKNNPIIKNKKI